MKTIIVGGGLAGLVCADMLVEKGEEVILLEAGDGPGGRVRTDLHNMYLLDRGFQVLFTAYPSVKRHLDLPALDLRPFDPGVIISKDGVNNVLSDPRRDLNALTHSMVNPLIEVGDKIRTLRLNYTLASSSSAELRAEPEESTEAYLRNRGFSEHYLDNFVRPFYGGIMLDRALRASSRVFSFTFKMMAEGNIAVPSHGMGAVPAQLANRLPAGVIRYNSAVTELLYTEAGQGKRKVKGVKTASEEIEGTNVVLACDLPTTAHLANLGESCAWEALPYVTVYFTTPISLYDDKKIVVNANANAFVNNLVQMDNVVTEYALGGEHLISTTIIDPAALAMSDEELYKRTIEDIARIIVERPVEVELKPLAIYRIPFAQFAQPPRQRSRLPYNRTATEGLYLAGEYTEMSSIHGALTSGEKVALAILAE